MTAEVSTMVAYALVAVLLWGYAGMLALERLVQSRSPKE